MQAVPEPQVAPVGKAGHKVETWASTYSTVPKEYFQPSSLVELQAVVKAAAAGQRKVRVVGAAHSPNACAMSEDMMVNLDKFNKVLAVDTEAMTIKVSLLGDCMRGVKRTRNVRRRSKVVHAWKTCTRCWTSMAWQLPT